MLLFRDVLYMLVRYASPSGSMCLRCLMLSLPGPVELLFLLCFIAAWTCGVVSVMLVVCSFSVFLYMCLFVLCVLCLAVLVNCLLNAFANCVGQVNVFSLKAIVFFCWLIRVLSSNEYAFCALMLFLCYISCLICSGSSLHVECILPFGMLCCLCGE